MRGVVVPVDAGSIVGWQGCVPAERYMFLEDFRIMWVYYIYNKKVLGKTNFS